MINLSFYFNLLFDLLSLNVSNTKILHAFSTGNDSNILLQYLLHSRYQFSNNLYLSYKNHSLQPANLYTEYHLFKIAILYNLPYNSSLFLEDRQTSEFKYKQYRYDLLLRESLFTGFSTIITSHTQTDYLESKFIEFATSGTFKTLPHVNKKINYNRLLSDWPIPVFKSPYENKNYFFKYKHSATIFLRKNMVILQRPFSYIPRNIICKISTEYRLPVQADFTNFNNYYLHNICRHQLLPLFRSKFGVSFDKTLYKASYIKLFDRIKIKHVANFPIKTKDNFSYFYYDAKNLFINLNVILQLDEQDWELYLVTLNEFYNLNCLRSDFKLLFSKAFQNKNYILRITYPQLLVWNNYLVVRF